LVWVILCVAILCQTRWFLAGLATVVVLVAVVYRLRVRQIAAAMSARFDERLVERTRVAREIHDTLLQTVQGSKMVADHALKTPADHARLLRAVEQVSTWLGQAAEESRAALNSLRVSTRQANDFAEALQRALDECLTMTNTVGTLSVSGQAKDLHPVVRDEIYRIAYEGIRNACTHGGGARLDVWLDYAHDITVRVSDNGVGIPAEILEKGKHGHFGLRGMKERADRIGAQVGIASSPGSGTLVTLTVPGSIAYSSAGPTKKDG